MQDFKLILSMSSSNLPKYLRTLAVAVQYAGQNTTPGMEADARQAALRAAAAAKAAAAAAAAAAADKDKTPNQKKDRPKDGTSSANRNPKVPKLGNQPIHPQPEDDDMVPILSDDDTNPMPRDVPTDTFPKDMTAPGLTVPITPSPPPVTVLPMNAATTFSTTDAASKGYTGVAMSHMPVDASPAMGTALPLEAEAGKGNKASEVPIMPVSQSKPLLPEINQNAQQYAMQQMFSPQPQHPNPYAFAQYGGVAQQPPPWFAPPCMPAYPFPYYGWPPPPSTCWGPPPPQWGAPQAPCQQTNVNALPQTPPRVREAALIAKMKCDVDAMKANLVEAEYKYLHR